MLYTRVRTAYEAECAERGGADVLILAGTDPLASPLPNVVDEVRRASTLHLRVVLRLRGGYTTDGGEMTRLRGLASSYRGAGADGFVFGFLNAMAGIDVGACGELAGDDTWGWTFDRAIDAVLDRDTAWTALESLPRLDSVMTAGSARRVEFGLDRLIGLGESRWGVIAAGGLAPEHVPWLVRGGITRFYPDDPPSSADAVAAWRGLIDEEMARARTRG